MRISVLIPAFRAASKLPATIDSALAQGDEVEIVVVDGASQDGTLDVLRHYAAEHGDRFRFVSEPDAGVYDAMNKALRMARGDYVTFFGAGDTLAPGIVARLLPSLPADNTLRFVYGGVLRHKRPAVRRFNRFTFTRLNICHQGIYYGRQLVERIGDYKQHYRLLGDWEYNLRCWADVSIPKVYVPLVFAEYEGGGISDTGSDENFRGEEATLFRKYLGFLPFVWYHVWHSLWLTIVWFYWNLGIKAARDRWFR